LCVCVFLYWYSRVEYLYLHTLDLRFETYRDPLQRWPWRLQQSKDVRIQLEVLRRPSTKWEIVHCLAASAWKFSSEVSQRARQTYHIHCRPQWMSIHNSLLHPNVKIMQRRVSVFRAPFLTSCWLLLYISDSQQRRHACMDHSVIFVR